ncbi:MAG: hypothetical protein Q7S47_01905 [bacterium]|nr:hypothetical protein [bacterium]
MLVDFLTSKYQRHLDEAWGAFEVGNLEKAEQHFRFVLKHHEDPHMTPMDGVDAHAGIGAINVAHKDFFEATRWYKEAYHMLEKHYGDVADGGWPKRMQWHHPVDRPTMRTLMGLGHLAYHAKRLKNAEKFYSHLLDCNPKDELGAKRYLAGIKEKETFEECV